jgi:hypothetical protein
MSVTSATTILWLSSLALPCLLFLAVDRLRSLLANLAWAALCIGIGWLLTVAYAMAAHALALTAASATDYATVFVSDGAPAAFATVFGWIPSSVAIASVWAARWYLPRRRQSGSADRAPGSSARVKATRQAGGPRTAEMAADPKHVVDESSFLAFAKSLLQDRTRAEAMEAKHPSAFYGQSHLGWENTTISGFLEGAVGWAEDSDFGATQGIDSSDPWKKFAVFLYCGKIYE